MGKTLNKIIYILVFGVFIYSCSTSKKKEIVYKYYITDSLVHERKGYYILKNNIHKYFTNNLDYSECLLFKSIVYKKGSFIYDNYECNNILDTIFITGNKCNKYNVIKFEYDKLDIYDDEEIIYFTIKYGIIACYSSEWNSYYIFEREDVDKIIIKNVLLDIKKSKFIPPPPKRLNKN